MLASVSTMSEGHVVGYSQQRWLDPKQRISITHRIGVFESQEDAERAGASFAVNSQCVALECRASPAGSDRDHFEVYGTSLPTTVAASPIIVPSVDLPAEPGALLLITRFPTDGDFASWPLVLGARGTLVRARLALDAIRERAPLSKPFDDFPASPASQARTGVAYFARALPDFAFMGFDHGRRAPPGGGALGSAVWGTAGLLADCLKAVPCLAFGVLNLAVAGTRACFTSPRSPTS